MKPLIELFQLPEVKIDFSGKHLLRDGIVHEFEDEFAEYVGGRYAVGVCSCTMAIYLVLTYVKHMNADVTVPTMAPPVVANAVIHSGVPWRFVDDPEWVGGDYVLAEIPGVGRIVDSAQHVRKDCFKYKSSFASLFSFYPTKPVGGIDGGMVVTDCAHMAEWLRMAAENGSRGIDSSWLRIQEFVGWKAYLSTAQAIIARESLKSWPKRHDRLSEISSQYDKVLSRVGRGDHLYRVNSRRNTVDSANLHEKGIASGVHYNCLHDLRVYLSYSFGIFPRSEEASKTVLSIPFHAGLSDDDVETVIKAVKEI